MMLPQWEFLYDLEDLMKQKGDFYPENNENTDDLIKEFMKKHSNEKINSFMDLKKILNVELGNSKREQQAKVINFIIENLCKKDIIESERQMDDLVEVLRNKFGDSQVIIILKKLKEKVLKTNSYLKLIIEKRITDLNENEKESIQNNPKHTGKNLNWNKNLNTSPKKYKNDKAKNNDQKSVYERINNNQVNQNPGPAPQIKVHDGLDKKY